MNIANLLFKDNSQRETLSANPHFGLLASFSGSWKNDRVADMKSNNEQSEYWYVWPKLKPAIINLIKKYKIKIIKKD